MSTSLYNSSGITSSPIPTSTQLTPQSAKHMLSKINNLNDVFEFAKTDENSKYLADSISRNFKSKRIKLKEIIDEVVDLQTESNRLELTCESNSAYVDPKPAIKNKKTLVSILSSPATKKQKNFNLPCLNHKSFVLNTTQQFSSISDKSFKAIGKTSRKDHLKDIFELIKLNNQSSEVTTNSNTINKLFIEYKPEDDHAFENDSNEQKKRKSFISKLNEKEQVLSNNINRNMELLQNCLQTNLEYKKKSEEKTRKNPLRLVKLGSVPMELTTKKISPLLTSLEDSFESDCPKTKKKLNFYSIGNFNSRKILKKKDDEEEEEEEEEEEINIDDDYSSALNQMNELIILNEENKESNLIELSVKSPIHICHVCGLKLKKLSMLKLHMKSHNNLKPFLCSWCNVAFKTKGNLAKHMKSQGHFRRCLEQGINASNSEDINKLLTNTAHLNAFNEQVELNSSISFSNE